MGGVIHQTVKTKPFNKRNLKTPPITIDSYQKGYKCITKNTPQTREAWNSEPPRLPTYLIHTNTLKN